MARTLTIAFCDDDPHDREQMHALVHGSLARLKPEARFFDLASAEALVCEGTSRFDLIFLDIEMAGENGLAAARSVRRENATVPIVFVTAHPNYAIEGYGVGAYRYLLKPVDEERFRLDIEPLLRELASETNGSVAIRCEDEIAVVSLRDVLYVTTGEAKHVHVVTTGRTYDAVDSLKHWEQLIDDAGSADFFRCHGSVIVNFRYIRNIRPTEVVMADGTSLPLSRRRRRELSEAALRYRGFHA